MDKPFSAGVDAAKGTDKQSGHLLDAYSPQPASNNSKESSPYYKSQAPVIELPKGGGALKGIDEKFTVNAVNGTSSLQVALPLTPGRSGFTPNLSLQYNSGSGNGEFGLGWGLSLPAIQRKSDKQLPRYNSEDVFLLAGAEDLVPVTDEGEVVVVTSGLYTIRPYKPRIEGLFARIEHITEDASGENWWRVITKDNMVTYYGLTASARIAHPHHPLRIYKWLPEFSYDKKGNVQIYEYKPEDKVNVPLSAHERNHIETELSNTYLKRVHYCNTLPYLYDEEDSPYKPDIPLPGDLECRVSVVMDYGDHFDTEDQAHIPYGDGDWPCRTDPFSDYHAGFNIRTYRLCYRALVFHAFVDEKDMVLARSLDLSYQHEGDTPNQYSEADYITTITQSGYTQLPATSEEYIKKSLPSLTLTHNPLQWDTRWQSVSETDTQNAPQGLTGPYQWIDLWGEGISGILTEQNSGWYYKQNFGNGNFTPATLISPKPSLQGLGTSLQWQDLDADGRRQIVSRSAQTPGYYELDDDQEWQSFHTFGDNVNIDWDSPYTKTLDLNGDGRPDLLLTEDLVWTWYKNEGKKGFKLGGRNNTVIDEENGPRLILNDNVQSIFLADMNGDGLTDIVRIRNGSVCYWPNMGYGRFGKKTTMSNAPVFDNPDIFNPMYVTLADISGTGAADIIYIAKGNCTAYINLAGNAFSPAQFISTLPGVEPYSKIAVLDFLGNGTGCIVWSSPLPQHAHAPMRYIDLMRGDKPYLMTSYNSGMGKTVELEYKSSTKYYLADKLAGKQWATRLPFPVHCVSKITTTDTVSETTYAQLYTYHHGYYDHEEREFRGFGRVDVTDTDGAEGPDEELDQAPVITKTWYHTGAWMREKTLLDAFEEEYYVPAGSWPMLPQQAQFPGGLTAVELREAHRALKGLPLRQEVYAFEDEDVGEEIPGTLVLYNITAFAYCVELEQPRHPNKYASFYTYQQHKVTYNCERVEEDPRIAHELTLEVDDYGNILQAAQVVYKRATIPNSLPDVVEAAQARMYITYNSNTYTDIIEGEEHYLLPLPATTASYELYIYPGTGFENYPDGLWTLEDLLESIPVSESDFSTAMSGTTDLLRVLGKTRNIYLANDAVTQLTLGTADTIALPYKQYTLAVTPAMLSAYSSAIDGTMLGNAGYAVIDSKHWLQSGRMTYTTVSLQDTFYMPASYRDPFDNRVKITYYHQLLPKSTEDDLGNIVNIDSYDWRNLQPTQITDANNNVSRMLYDTLGMPVAMALMGKVTEPPSYTFEGDELALNDADPDVHDPILPDNNDDADLQTHFWTQDDVEEDAKALLGRTTWRCIYNLDITNGPVGVAMIARQQHYNPDAIGADSDVLVRVTYTDGMGRVAMHKAQFAPLGATAQWVGSGKTVYNNKGNVVMQYEPFITTTHQYEPAFAGGVTPRMHYDPLGRLKRTDLPDGSFTKTIWDAWKQEVWDNNDTLTTGDAWCDAHSSDTHTVNKALAHAKTPTVMHLDTLARPFYTIQYLEDYTIITPAPATIESYETLDIQGNRIKVTDGRANDILQYNYDMLKSPLKQVSADSGTQHMLLAVDGQPFYNKDAASNEFTFVYDVLRRPVEKRVYDGSVKKLEILVYGDGLTTPELENLRGKLVTHKDGAGIVTTDRYDFKGNPLESAREFTTGYTAHPDWSGSPSMEGKLYKTRTAYDALNRVIILTTPDGAETMHTYDEGGYLSSVSVDNVRGLDTDVINSIKYNAKGQRLKVTYENTATTEYEYDAETFRVTRIYTWRPDSSPGLPDDGHLQDLNYFYDPVGNITRLENHAEETIFFSNTIVSPDLYYTYDALYRLIKAYGREHAGDDTAPTFDDAARIDRHSPSESSAVVLRRYKQVYTYDEAGNMTQMKHRVGGSDSWTRNYTISNTSNRTTGNSIGSKNVTAETYTYDARGNITEGFNNLLTGSASMIYNAANRLEAVIKNADITDYYQYDGAGQRVRKVNFNDDGDIVKERKYIGGYELYEESGGVADYMQETLHVMDDSTRVMMIETELEDVPPLTVVNQVIRYQYSNHLGSSALELDDTATVISYEEYYPFGNTSFQSINNNISQKRYRFTGKERDELSGFYYHSARYYVCWLARWCASDPLESKYAGLSSYNYGFNNPITWQDSTGMEPDEKDSTANKASVSKDNNSSLLSNVKSVFLPQINLKESIQIKEDVQSNGSIKSEEYSPVVRKLLDKIHKSEGEYVDNPNDPGGKTKFGIAEHKEWKLFAEFTGINSDTSNIKNITSEQADKYYVYTRLETYKIDQMQNEKIANAIFNQSVITPGLINKNVKQALNDLGYSFNINSSKLNEEQIKAINNIDPDKFVEKFTDHQLKYYESLKDKGPQQLKNYNEHIGGWKNRLNELKNYKK